MRTESHASISSWKYENKMALTFLLGKQVTTFQSALVSRAVTVWTVVISAEQIVQVG